MIFENADNWVGDFKRCEEHLLERICKILPDCIATMPDNPKEDEITTYLIYRFNLDADTRRLFHHCEYQFEPFGQDEKDVAYSKGKIDFAVFLDKNRENYLAYEAK